LSEKLPETTPTESADVLAQDVMMKLGKEGWDTTKFLKWTFRTDNSYFWNKEQNLAIIEWGEMKVYMNLDSVDGIAYKNDQLVPKEETKHCINKAWEYWCNDSFWLMAPFKMNDPGTVRSIVENVEIGEKGLMVAYESGGVTPGDTYLWLLDKNNRPLGFKIWVEILPVKGLFASWENWQSFDPGFELATHHKISFLDFDIKGIQTGNSFRDFGYEMDPFVDLKNTN
jgi:hypothetical protein